MGRRLPVNSSAGGRSGRRNNAESRKPTGSRTGRSGNPGQSGNSVRIWLFGRLGAVRAVMITEKYSTVEVEVTMLRISDAFTCSRCSYGLDSSPWIDGLICLYWQVRMPPILTQLQASSWHTPSCRRFSWRLVDLADWSPLDPRNRQWCLHCFDLSLSGRYGCCFGSNSLHDDACYNSRKLREVD